MPCQEQACYPLIATCNGVWGLSASCTPPAWIGDTGPWWCRCGSQRSCFCYGQHPGTPPQSCQLAALLAVSGVWVAPSHPKGEPSSHSSHPYFIFQQQRQKQKEEEEDFQLPRVDHSKWANLTVGSLGLGGCICALLVTHILHIVYIFAWWVEQ